MRGAYLDRIDAHPRWWEINRNKRSVTLDLHRPDHVAAFEALVRTADVVVENSRPGVYEGLGVGPERLRALRPELIVVSMSAYGAGGPESQYAGYGAAIEAVSGVQSLTAYERGGEPVRVRELDVTNGLMGACAILTALVQRAATGEGQWVDLSQCEASTWMIGDHLLERVVNGAQTLPLGNRHPRYAPQGCYPCAGEDCWLVLTVRDDAEWRRLGEALGDPAWAADARFAGVEGRRAHHDEIDRRLAEHTRGRDREELVERLQACGIPAGPVVTVRDIVADPHLAARGWLQTAEDDPAARYPGLPFRFAEGGGRFARRGPALGEGNQEILGERLGLSRSLLESIRALPIGTAFDVR
jgi:crotonobetainyl-CoA:carnitine CoA-transferase CaiB-like acyl-CoA transferase